MEKVAVTGKNARTSGKSNKAGLCAAASLAFVAGCPAAWAQDTSELPAEALVLAQARNQQTPVRVQVQTTALPRLEAQDSGYQAPRVDLSLLPARGQGISPMMGMSMGASTPAGLGLQPVGPSFDLGVRWTHRQLDVMAWRRMNTADDAYTQIQMREPMYGARVEMNIKPSKFGALGFDSGFVGLQLEGGGRISIKRKYGGPMIYYRTTF